MAMWSKTGRPDDELNSTILEHFESQAPPRDAVDTLHRSGSNSRCDCSSSAEHDSCPSRRQERPGNSGQQQSRRWLWTRCRLLAIGIAVLSSTAFAKPPLNELTRNSPLLRGQQRAGRAGQLGAEGACEFESGRDAPSACKFFILDVSEIAAELGLPTCNEARLATDPETGMALPDPKFVAPNATIPEPPEDHEWIYPYTVAPHYHSQNAGPWYVYHTLRNSKQAVDTIDEADVVYVYDYCYMMWLLSDHHARQHWWLRSNYEPPSGTGSNLLAMYRAIMALPKWQRNGGRDFAFYHSHSGFEWEDMEITNKYMDMLCQDFQWATMVVVEQMQRWRCASYTPRTTVIAPYSSTEVVRALPESEKLTLLFFRGDCEPPVPSNVGKYMRARAVATLRAVHEEENRRMGGSADEYDGEDAPGDDLNVCCHGRAAAEEVACTDAEFTLNELKVQPHQGMLESMAGSVFCLIMPGNSQSSQRLTEAFIAGCIPVFLGPPWHTLPFSAEVDYAAAGIFINITTDSEDGDSAPWWQLDGESMAPGLEPLSPVEDRFSPLWWFPDVPKQAIGSIRKLENLLPFLRQLDEELVQEKISAVQRYRSMFVFATQPQHPPSASDMIVELMCTKAKFGLRD